MKDKTLEKIILLLQKFFKRDPGIKIIPITEGKGKNLVRKINIYYSRKEKNRKLIKAAEMRVGDKKISIRLERGGIHRYIDLAQKLHKLKPDVGNDFYHVILYLSYPYSNRSGIVAFDSNHPSGWRTKEKKV